MNARALYLAATAAVAIAAVGPPLDRLADRSFSWHMLQHLVLLFVVPLMLLLARPFELFAALAGKQTTVAFVRGTRALHLLAQPPIALAAFIGTLWLTHFTPLYQLSLQHPFVHIAEHALYLAAGTLFWLPVLAPPPLRPLAYPVRLLYLAVALPQGALVAMAIGSARAPLYPHYAALAGTQAALADQVDAAAVMWILGGLVVLTALLGTLGSWARREAV
ncbi:MAG TPA: cytochrome c oxidase assembly protein [Candidatus Cybelea sp.]|jgi:putative copper resistance protein D